MDYALIANIDTIINQFSADNVTPFIASAASVISAIGDKFVIGGLGLLLCIMYISRRKWQPATLFVLSIGMTGAFVGIIKAVVMRARPENALQVLSDYGFPSGHAGLAAAFFVVLAYVMTIHIESRAKRYWITAVCALATLAIGVSRIALNVHWASDVIAGWSLGILCAATAIFIVRNTRIFARKSSDYR